MADVKKRTNDTQDQKQNQPSTSNGTNAQNAGTQRERGLPGDGAGRTEDTESQHAGVWPASGPPMPDPNTPYQPMASFGQGERGAAGYADSGQSEVFTMPPKGVPKPGSAAAPGVGENEESGAGEQGGASKTKNRGGNRSGQ
jgi:hypothetical protein